MTKTKQQGVFQLRIQPDADRVLHTQPLDQTHSAADICRARRNLAATDGEVAQTQKRRLPKETAFCVSNIV
jgi:hypothetical protein